jgi:hypothetical protein
LPLDKAKSSVAPWKSQPASKHDGQDLHSTETWRGWLFGFRSPEPGERGWRILFTSNSPYKKPRFHHPLDDHGKPLGLPPVETRRPSKFIVPVPQARRRAAGAQGALPLETYSDSAIISEIRGHVDAWRCLSEGADSARQLGWIDGNNLRIDYRWSTGDSEQVRKDAVDLVSLALDVLLATGSSSVAALQQATRTVPIVFALVSDPVGAGFVDSLPRPGGNATGFTNFEYFISPKC